MSKVVILEGPDGSGKSTLAQALIAKGYRYMHNGLYPNETGKELLDKYTEQIVLGLRGISPLVIDRSFLSETAYGTVMRNEDRLGDYGLRLMTRLTRSRDVLEIICLPSWNVVNTNWLEKRKEKFDPEKRTGDYVDAVVKLRRIYDWYRARLRSFTHYMRYDYVFDSLSILGPMSPIHVVHEPLPSGVVGSPDACYLIVGEQVNANKVRHDLPFHDLGGASQFLDYSIGRVLIDERHLAWTNALDLLGRERDLRMAVRSLPRFYRAIALGLKAQALCDEQKIPYIGLAHPQYWKRFKKQDERTYHHLLSEALCA